MNRKKIEINIGQLLSALSLSLDVAENRYFDHSRRTAYMAYSIAHALKLDNQIKMYTYYSALIHDIGMGGVMSTHNIFKIDSDKDLKKQHCTLGSQIVKTLPFEEDISPYILYHHEHWDGQGPFGLKGDEIPLPAQIIRIADYFDINYGSKIKSLNDYDFIKNEISDQKGKIFSRYIVDAFLEVMSKDKFWLDLKYQNIQQILDITVEDIHKIIDIDDLKKIANTFASLIDSKSNFTLNHSKGIAKITRKLASYMGYEESIIDKLEIAAYLHDIGKLVIPNDILEKPGKLSSTEFDIIKAHPYYTKLILRQVKGLEHIAQWAGNHHEKLNGKGYPERLDNQSITIEDQIIAVADIYQALIEDRPYRKGLSHLEAIDVLKKMAAGGFIYESLVTSLDKAI